MASKKKVAAGPKVVNGFEVFEDLPANPARQMPERGNVVASKINEAIAAGVLDTGKWVLIKQFNTPFAATSAKKRLIEDVDSGKATIETDRIVDIEVRRYEYMATVTDDNGDETDVTRKGSRLFARFTEEEAGEPEADENESED